MATTSAVRLDGGDDRTGAYGRPQLDRDIDIEAESVLMDQLLAPTEAVNINGDVVVDEVDVQPQPPKGAPMTMRELAESYARRQGEGTPPLPEEKEGDLPISKTAHALEEVMREAPGRRTAKRRASTRTTRTSKKRARRGTDESGNASDVDGDGTPPKRRQVEASATLAASTPSSNPGSGRVLRPRPQKSAVRAQEEREMEEAYRRAVAG